MIVKIFDVPRMKQKIPYVLAENQQIILMPVGDFHYGVKHFPKDRFKKHFKWGLDRGAYFLGMGDYIDFASYSQRMLMAPMRDETRMIIAEKVTDMIEQLTAILEPTRGRWIGLLEGHHRFEFLDGTSSDQLLCEKLGCDFLGTSTMITLRFKGVPIDRPEAFPIIFAHHGISTSRTMGGQLHRLEDLLKWQPETDIFLMAHSHAKITGTVDAQKLTPPPECILYHETKIAARTGGWLKQYNAIRPQLLSLPAVKSRGTYVEEKLFSPTALGGLCFGIGYGRISGSGLYRPTIHYSV